jgi:hypothetical protein
MLYQWSKGSSGRRLGIIIMTNTKPTQEQIDFASDEFQNLYDSSQSEQLFLEGYMYVENVATILAALEAYRPVDVEGLKMIPDTNPVLQDRNQLYDDGWNDCLDHLVEKGIIKMKYPDYQLTKGILSDDPNIAYEAGRKKGWNDCLDRLIEKRIIND